MKNLLSVLCMMVALVLTSCSDGLVSTDAGDLDFDVAGKRSAQKVDVCHFPVDAPDAPVVIRVSANAVKAHVGHHPFDGIVGDVYDDDCRYLEPTNVALGGLVTLHGEFFAGGGWFAGISAEASTLVDGEFFPKDHQWNLGPIWWWGDAPWISVDLGRSYTIESLILQGDVNDTYVVSYLDESGDWQVLWIAAQVGGWGMQTRPNPSSDTERFELSAPVRTSALRIDGRGPSDFHYAVSEFQAYGR